MKLFGKNMGSLRIGNGIPDRTLAADRECAGRICELAMPYLSADQNVLEICCGRGVLSRRLAGYVHFWEAVDFSAAMIQAAKNDGYDSRIHFAVQEPFALPYEEGSFDVVFTAGGFGMTQQPEKMLSEIRRVLREDGILLAVNPVSGGGRATRLRYAMLHIGGAFALPKWSAKDFRGLFTANGFTIIDGSRIETKTKQYAVFLSAVPGTGIPKILAAVHAPAGSEKQESQDDTGEPGRDGTPHASAGNEEREETENEE